MDFRKTHGIESRFVIGPENTLRRRVRALFSPEVVPAWLPGLSEGVNESTPPSAVCHSLLVAVSVRVPMLESARSARRVVERGNRSVLSARLVVHVLLVVRVSPRRRI